MLVVGHDSEVVVSELLQPRHGVGQSTDLNVLEKSRGDMEYHIHAQISVEVDKAEMSNCSPGGLFKRYTGNGLNNISLSLRLSIH